MTKMMDSNTLLEIPTCTFSGLYVYSFRKKIFTCRFIPTCTTFPHLRVGVSLSLGDVVVSAEGTPNLELNLEIIKKYIHTICCSCWTKQKTKFLYEETHNSHLSLPKMPCNSHYSNEEFSKILKNSKIISTNMLNIPFVQ